MYTHVHGRPMDGDEFEPFYARMAAHGKPLQWHPCRSSAWPDYPTEERSRYERHPDLRVLVHHGGAMVPFFSGRVGPGWDQLGARTPDDQRVDVEGPPLSRRPVEYFRSMYADIAPEAIFSGNAARLIGLEIAA